MQITPDFRLQSNARTQVAFGGNRLFPVQVFNKERDKSIIARFVGELVPEKCYFTELNEEDYFLLSKLKKEWPRTSYGGCIISSFLNRVESPLKYKNKKFFMIESANQINPVDRVKALARVIFDEKKVMGLEYLQSSSSLSATKNVTGAGQAMMYGLGRYAQNNKIGCIVVSSAENARKFYDKLGMQVCGSSKYILSKENYSEFTDKLVKKMKLSPSDICKTEGGLA